MKRRYTTTTQRIYNYFGLCALLVCSIITATNAQSITWELTGKIPQVAFDLKLLPASNGDLYTTTGLHSSDLGKTWTSNQLNARSGTSTLDGRTLLGTDKGLFYLAPGGWKELSNDLQNDSIDNIAIRTSNEWFVRSGHAIYRSTDAGATWSKEGELAFLKNYSYSRVNGLGVTPDGTLLTSIEFEPMIGMPVHDSTGIYRSLDRGKTWKQTTFNPTNITNNEFMTMRLFHTSIDGTIFTGVQTFGGAGRVYRSTDEGASWASTPLQDVSFTMVHTPDGTLFATGANSGVYRSTDRGKTWITINNGLFEFRIFPLALDQDGFLFVIDVFGNVSKTKEKVYSAASVKQPISPSISIQPNPARNLTNLRMDLDRSSKLSLELYNLLGQSVRKIPEQLYQPGSHLLHLETENLPAGTYQLLLQGNGKQELSFPLIITQ